MWQLSENDEKKFADLSEAMKQNTTEMGQARDSSPTASAKRLVPRKGCLNSGLRVGNRVQFSDKSPEQRIIRKKICCDFQACLRLVSLIFPILFVKL